MLATRTLVLGLALVLAIAACTRESSEDTNEGTDPSPGEAVIEVLITDDGIEMPEELPAGPLLFEVTNGGTVAHGFAIDGVDGALDSLQPDQLDTLRTELTPGSHTVYSPVEGDRESGLEITVTATETAGASGAPLGDEGVSGSEQQAPIGTETP